MSALDASAAAPGDPYLAFGHDGVLEIDVPGGDYPSAMVRTTDGRLAVVIDHPAGVEVAMMSSDGELDRTFAGDGTLRLAFHGLRATSAGSGAVGGGAVLVALWTVPRGAAAGEGQRLLLARVLPDGRLDPSFGEGGVAGTALGEVAPLDHFPAGVAIAPDGRIYVIGLTGAATFYAGAAVAAILRFDPNGSRDTTYGAGGLVPIVGQGGAVPVIAGFAVDATGRVLVGEIAYPAAPLRADLIVRRFDDRGVPDVTYGAAGVAWIDLPGDWDSMTGLRLDAAGRLVVIGHAFAGVVDGIAHAAGAAPGAAPLDEGFSPAIARLTPAGRLDATFGVGGVAVVHRDGQGRRLGWPDAARVVGDGGTYLVAGLERANGLRATLVRIDRNGRLDPAFGGTRRADLPMDHARAVEAFGSHVVVAGPRDWADGGTVLAAYSR